MTVESAKEFLTSKGYFTANLWTVYDVKGKFNCTDEEAQTVLSQALQNAATMEQIWFSIDTFGEMNNLEKIEEE